MAVLPNVRLAYDCIIKRWHVNISNAHSLLHLHIIAAKKIARTSIINLFPCHLMPSRASTNRCLSHISRWCVWYLSRLTRLLTKPVLIKRLATVVKEAELLQGHSIRIDATLFYLLQGVSIDSEAMRIMEWRFLAVFRAQEACPNSNVIHSGQSGRTWNGIHTRHLVIGRSTYMGVAKGHSLNQRGKEQMAAVSPSSPLLIEWGTRFNSHSLVASCRHTPMTRFSAHLLPFTLSLNLTVTTRRIGSGSDSRLHSIGLPPPLLHYLSQYHT